MHEHRGGRHTEIPSNSRILGPVTTASGARFAGLEHGPSQAYTGWKSHYLDRHCTFQANQESHTAIHDHIRWYIVHVHNMCGTDAQPCTHSSRHKRLPWTRILFLSRRCPAACRTRSTRKARETRRSTQAKLCLSRSACHSAIHDDDSCRLCACTWRVPVYLSV